MTTIVTYDHWISGVAHPPSSGAYLDSVDPRTGRVAARIAAGGSSDVDRAARAAEAAAPAWGRSSAAERSRILRRIADAVRDAAPRIAQLEVAETGKPLPLAMMEAEGVAEFLEYYAGVVRAVSGDTLDLGPEQRVLSDRIPYGVIGVITPWNAPVYSATRGVAPALAAGNAVIVKPSEFTSTTTLELARIATRAGLPDGVLNVVTGRGADVGEALVRHRTIRKLSFTGSVETGRAVARIAGDRLLPLVLELGGKSPQIVFADADLAAAAAGVASGFTMNTGQVCAAGSRLLVERSIHDRFVDAVAEHLRAERVAEGLGPIITEGQHRKVREYVELATAEGATPTSAAAAREGQFVDPTILTGVRSEMRIAQEEVFGPVLAVIPFDSESEAVRIANDSDYGLVSGVWTRDIDRAFRVAQALETGQVFVNQFGSLDVETPFGGMKDSGYGREKGLEALREFTQVKSIMIRIDTTGGAR